MYISLTLQNVFVCVTVSPKCCSVRCNLAAMMFFGFAVVYGLRVNLSVAMVAMVNGTSNQSSLSSNISNECPEPHHTLDNSSQSLEQPDGVRNRNGMHSFQRRTWYIHVFLVF